MMGVVYPIGDDLRDLIIPYLRSQGFNLPDQVFIDAYRRCYRGGSNAESFWQSIAAKPPFDELEARLLCQYTLTGGALAFLRQLRADDIPVFSLTNDVAEWAVKRRQLLGIDEYFSGAVLSGVLGVAKPEPAIYQALIELLPWAPAECLFVDDRPANLDGAAKEGLATVLFGTKKAEAHDVVADFAALADYVGLTPAGGLAPAR
jgi:HAD superfamily hydrolase (TIGR01509 family)